VSIHGVKTAASLTAGATYVLVSSASDARESAAGICEPQACHTDRDSAHGYTAPNGQLRGVPSESPAMPSASRSRAVRPERLPPAAT